MRNLTFLLLLVSTFPCFAQPENATIELINGKKYYVHIVQSGNTLWGMHKVYGASAEDIVKANPEIENGFNEGQKVLIPVPTETILHEVATKETLFGISKKYSVTIEQIILTNPEAEAGIKVGQKLKIPGVESALLLETKNTSSEDENLNTDVKKTSQTRLSFEDTVIIHAVLDHETLYSISKRFMVPVEELQKLNGLKNTRIKPGDAIKIPVKKERIEVVKIRQVEKIEKRKVDSTLLFPEKNSYNIALLLPFYLDKGDGSTSFVSTLATEFYMGAKLAIDSLEEIGMVAKVFVYDSRNDTITVKNILAKPEFKQMDIVFGPLFPENMNIVANWCKVNKVRLVCPAVANSSLLKNNPFVYNAIPSDATLAKGLAEFTLKNNSQDQIIIIKSNNDKDAVMYDSFRTTFLMSPVIGNRPKLIEATLENYASFMKKGSKVILVFPTNEKTLALKFMNSLSIAAQKFDADRIAVYGTKEWVNFDDIKPFYKNKFNFHFASPNDLNYKYPSTESLHRKFRYLYNSDMTKMAVQGFDVLFYFCTDLLLKKKNTELVMNNYSMKQKGTENGFENSNYYILEQEDFEFIQVQK
jgi:LysM repeat protein